jgi:hypothetical protein
MDCHGKETRWRRRRHGMEEFVEEVTRTCEGDDAGRRGTGGGAVGAREP